MYGVGISEDWEQLIDERALASPMMSSLPVQESQRIDRPTAPPAMSFLNVSSDLSPAMQNEGLMFFDAQLAAAMADYEDVPLDEVDIPSISHNIQLDHLNYFNEVGID